MNTLNNYILEKLFVDTEEEISSAIDQPAIIKTLEMLIKGNCNVTINKNNEIFIKGGELKLNNKNLKLLDNLFKNTNYRIKFCEVIIFDKINIVPQWINNAEVYGLVFRINKPNMVLQNISFDLNNIYKNSLFTPSVTFEIYKGASLPDTKNVIFNNKSNAFISIMFQEKFNFSELNYNFFNGIDIKGNNIEYISLYPFNTDPHKFTNAKYVEEYMDFKIKMYKELYNFYKKYCKYISVTYDFKNKYVAYRFTK